MAMDDDPDFSSLEKPKNKRQKSEGWDEDPDDEWGGDGEGKEDWGKLETDESESGTKQDKMNEAMTQRVESDLEELRMLGRFEAPKADFGGGSRIRVKLELPVRQLGLDAEQARAWSLDLTKRVVVDLIFPPHYFMVSDTSQIQVKIGQAKDSSSEVEAFRLSWTLTNQVKTIFLPSLEKKLIDRDYDLKVVQDVMEVTGVDFLLALYALRQKKQDSSAAMQMLFNKDERTKLVRQSSQDGEKHAKSGFFASLFGGKKKGSDSGTDDAAYLCQTFDVSTDVANLALQLEGGREGAVTLLSNEQQKKQLTAIAGGSLAKEEKKDVVTTPSQRTHLAAEFAKHNYLVACMLFVEDKLMNCNKFCIICSSPVEFAGVKPTVCGSDVCKMGFEDFGLAFNLDAELRDHPQVVDMYLTFAIAATNAGRMNFVTPANVRAMDEKSGKEVSFLANGDSIQANNDGRVPGGRGRKGGGQPAKEVKDESPALDLNRLSSCFAKCPSVAEMQAMSQKGKLKPYLDSLDPLLFPLIRWVLTSTRAHIRELTPEERIKGMNTDYQFVLMSSPPETEARFQNLKRGIEVSKGEGKGTIYAFHGSDTGNWHSILRTGLRVMSNTKFMTSGAAYGVGVYMAVDSGTSLGYCKTGGGWSKSMFGQNFRCLAICEVVNHPTLKPPHPYYVIPNEEWICTRFFFIYKDHTSSSVNISTVQTQLPDLSKGSKKH